MRKNSQAFQYTPKSGPPQLVVSAAKAVDNIVTAYLAGVHCCALQPGEHVIVRVAHHPSLGIISQITADGRFIFVGRAYGRGFVREWRKKVGGDGGVAFFRAYLSTGEVGDKDVLIITKTRAPAFDIGHDLLGQLRHTDHFGTADYCAQWVNLLNKTCESHGLAIHREILALLTPELRSGKGIVGEALRRQVVAHSERVLRQIAAGEQPHLEGPTSPAGQLASMLQRGLSPREALQATYPGELVDGDLFTNMETTHG